MAFAPAIPHPRAGLYCAMSVGIVALHERIPAAEILTGCGHGNRAATRARHLSMYLANVAFQVPVRDVARTLGLHRSAVDYALGRIEDERDARSVDEAVERMEAASWRCRHIAEAGAILAPAGILRQACGRA